MSLEESNIYKIALLDLSLIRIKVYIIYKYFSKLIKYNTSLIKIFFILFIINYINSNSSI